MSDKVLIICLDGATFDLLRPWIDDGHLPAFQRFIRDGVSGPLTSVVPPITAPAWASFITGKNPGKHGIYHFVNRGPLSGQQAFVSSASRTGLTLWRLLGEEGKRLAVLNVPTTYPPEEINGVLISDFLTPPGRRDFTYPQTLLDEIEEKFGRYPLHLKTLMFSANLSGANAERLLGELDHELKYKFAVAHYLLETREIDFLILHILGTDRIQHELWNFIDPAHPHFSPRMNERFAGKIRDYFVRVDAEIEQLESRMGGDATTLIISDHGFGPVHRAIDLNVWLLENGYIEIKDTARSRLKHRLWRMGLTNELIARLLLRTFFKYGAGIVERLSDETIFKSIRFFAQRGQRNPLFSLDDVDWSRTKAYALVGMGAVNMNLEGREPTGSVKPDAYQPLKEEIANRLGDLTDPKTGVPVNGYVAMREQVYHGPYLEQAPDIVFIPNDTGYVAGSMMGFTANRAIIDAPAWPGHHRMNGIIAARGKHVRKGKRLVDAGIVDLAPTVLYLMGGKIPQDMDGRILLDMFEEEFVSGRKIEYREGSSGLDAHATLSSDEEQQVIDRLKELGYLL